MWPHVKIFWPLVFFYLQGPILLDVTLCLIILEKKMVTKPESDIKILFMQILEIIWMYTLV